MASRGDAIHISGGTRVKGYENANGVPDRASLGEPTFLLGGGRMIAQMIVGRDDWTGKFSVLISPNF